MKDRYALSLATGSAPAAHAYIAAADNLLAAGGQLAEGFDKALAHDDGFALAMIGRARAHATMGRMVQARQDAARARELVAGASRREHSHVNALATVIERGGDEALDLIKTHMASHPGDALVLQPATGIFGLIGFSGRAGREQEFLALMQHHAPDFGDDWWFNSIRAFAEVECGLLTDAERRIERALSQRADNANGAHVVAHLHYESRAPQQAADFLRHWLATHPPGAVLRSHLAWHLALTELQLGNAGQAWALYETEFARVLDGDEVTSPVLNTLTDVASWLWRSELHGQAPRPAQWQRLADLVAARFARPTLAFADWHVALVHARCGNAEGFQAWVAAMQARVAIREEARPALAMAQGFGELVAGRHAAAASKFMAALDGNVQVGGSRAQRDLLEHSLLRALRTHGGQGANDTQGETDAPVENGAFGGDVARVFARRPQVAGGV